MTVIVPTALRQHTGNAGRLEIEGDSVGTVLSALVDAHPGLKDHLFDSTGDLAGYVNVFVNSDNIRDLEQMETQVSGRDELVLVPAIAGG